MRTGRAVVVAVSLAAVLSASCKGITTPSQNQNVPFSGTLQPRGANSHVFTVGRTGEFSAKLTAWAPNNQITAGLAWTLASNDNACTTGLQQNNFVLLNQQALFGQIGSGKYCVIVFDPGSLTAAQTYTVTVSHP